uniref:Band 7 domain-containing protein n=3 Tax=Eucampia antarctica TaxID=49252 RepID=A0A7S2WGS4_9STRA|mmetsp:Transcript_29886/g.28765  ORF Transcript_29886/g.28765 Transcript_29886/m.28765 type:complete len:281 (+) Transcript_29886:118-960(+)|eukprot:CAMPEP_0197828880 /NCGR_PEP_ID=MMETSP1437-20131217/5386_1 /TAXON_ID=49252 ORGANISM="Eucampia antarctica, Strain CCMP1452" /NCGR_SAMPLE_ID=MMETSP1437 /ASSEMBLY_ACC=CAM_ASM_001096 /LENGTH=280 /DNA_ID=CAMNT_0043430289 /DNA_START=122 /DNA_END=964 /DNA_ORIENTATION=-
MNDCCLLPCMICIRQQNVGIVEDLGQFKKFVEPGLHCIAWPMSTVAGTLSLRIQQLDVVCETKTKDDVFVNCGVAVQYRVVASSAYDAYYRLTDPEAQIKSYVYDVIRSTLPRLELDEAFASKADIAKATRTQLEGVMHEYGYQILEALVTEMMPDAKMKASLNEINASKRLKEAASHKAEADKIRQVKEAEADAEARYLSGLGVARQRRAIVQGLQESVTVFSEEVDGATPKDVMDILLLSQYFDTLSVVGANNLILEHDPATVADLQAQVGNSFLRSK